MSNETSVPDGWTLFSLPEVVFFQEGPGVRKWQFRDSGVKLLNGSNINNGNVDLDTTSIFISEEEAYGKYSHFLADAGDLVIASSGIVVDNFHNKIAFISKEQLPLCMNTSTIRFKTLDRKTLSLNFFRFFLCTNAFKSQLRRLVTGSAQLNFGPSHLRKIEIPLPSLDEQKRIAYLLSKVEGLIAQRKQHLQQLDALLKSVFLDMFGDPVANAKGWKTKPLTEIAFVKRGKFTPRPRNDPKYFDGPFPFIQTGDIARSQGRLSEFTQTLNELGTSVSRKFEIGTIVIAIVGATIGETAILEISTYATDSVIGITLKKAAFETEPVFLEFVMRHWKAPLRANAPEAARANINIATLKPLPIICPPSPLKRQFCQLAERIEALKVRYQQSMIDLESLYAVSSQQAFKGMLDLSRVVVPETPPDANEVIETTEQVEDKNDVTFELQTPNDVRYLGSTDGRIAIFEQWLVAYAKQLDTRPFSAAAFATLAQQKLAELQADDEGPDYGYEFGAEDYDYVKGWIFQSLESKRLKQDYDDANNRVQILAAKD